MRDNSTQALFKHAVVIGGSIAGLITAKALSAQFEKVTLLDRDTMPPGPHIRKRAPQGAHVHALLESGRLTIEKFYPGLFEEMTLNGANLIDTGDDLAWFHQGAWKTRYVSGIKMLLSTRPFLEWSIRRRTEAVSNISFLMETDVVGLMASPNKKSITGIKYCHKNEPSHIRDLPADLVVDASGRGSLAPGWLSDLGYEPPTEEHIGIDLSYTTCMFEKPATFKADWKFLVLYPKSPDNWRSGFISCVEEDRWIVSLNGYFKDSAPTEMAGFMEFAKTLPQQDIYNYIKNAHPISDIRIHKIPSSRWRNHDKLKSYPENLVCLGDSVCAFNPIFGQGMTVAAKSASLLSKMVAECGRSTPGKLKGLSDRYRKALPAVIKIPWFLATILDLKYPQTKGKRPLGHGFLAWYVVKLLDLTSTNKKVYHEFNKVLHLKQGLWAILKPGISLKVFAHGIKSFFVPLEKRANTTRIPYESGDSRTSVQKEGITV